MFCDIITDMKIRPSVCNVALLLAGTCSVCFSSSLLAPIKFPTTAADAGFITKLESKAEGYDRFAELTPYQLLILEKADENIETQIAADLASADEQPEMEDVDQNIEEQIAEDITSGGTDLTYTTNGTTAPAGEYCQVQHPNIPENQKIPFGSPVLHQDFVYCSPYGNLDRGRGLRPHTGYDIGCTLASYNRPVFATADGVVQLIRHNRTGKSAGNYIIVDHGNGFNTWYLHLNKILVKTGQSVTAGCQIGTIGNTGGSLESVGKNDKNPHFRKSMSHLHYEIRYTGNQTSVTASNGKKVKIQHGWPKNASIDPTHFICVYANFTYGHCNDTFPYRK